MLFSELYKIMVNRAIFVSFRGRSPPGSAPLKYNNRNRRQKIFNWGALRVGIQGGGAAAPQLEKFQGKLYFQGKHNLLKNPEW